MASEEVISEELGDIKIEYENLRSQLSKLENLLCQENGGEFGLSSRLQLQASKLFNKDQFSDVEVILKGGSHIKAHKMILAASGNDWGIEQFDQVDMLDLTDLRYEVGYALIKWVYTDDFGGYSIRMDDNFFVEMMQAAKVCQLKSLHVRCQKVLSTMVNNETCEKYLKLSEEFDAKILKDNCEKLLQKKKEPTVAKNRMKIVDVFDEDYYDKEEDMDDDDDDDDYFGDKMIKEGLKKNTDASNHGDSDEMKDAVAGNHGHSDVMKDTDAGNHGDSDVMKDAVAGNHGDSDVMKDTDAGNHGDSDVMKDAVAGNHGDSNVLKDAIAGMRKDADSMMKDADENKMDANKMADKDAGNDKIMNNGNDKIMNNICATDVDVLEQIIKLEVDDVTFDENSPMEEVTLSADAISNVQIQPTGINSATASSDTIEIAPLSETAVGSKIAAIEARETTLDKTAAIEARETTPSKTAAIETRQTTLNKTAKVVITPTNEKASTSATSYPNIVLKQLSTADEKAQSIPGDLQIKQEPVEGTYVSLLTGDIKTFPKPVTPVVQSSSNVATSAGNETNDNELDHSYTTPSKNPAVKDISLRPIINSPNILVPIKQTKLVANPVTVKTENYIDKLRNILYAPDEYHQPKPMSYIFKTFPPGLYVDQPIITFHGNSLNTGNMRLRSAARIKTEPLDTYVPNSTTNTNSQPLKEGKRKDYICDVCGKIFKDWSSWNKHKTVFFKDMHWKCDSCQKAFHTLHASKKENHGCGLSIKGKVYGCEICNKVFKSGRIWRLHDRFTHQGFEREKRPKVSKPSKSNKPLKLYECDVCGKILKDSTSLKRHKTVYFPDMHYRCEVCNNAFHNYHDSQTENHGCGLSVKGKVWHCDICDVPFKSGKSLKYHHKSKHLNLSSFQCDICGKSFKSSAFRYHMRRHHAQTKDIACHICGKAYAIERDLKSHIKSIHENPKQFCCEVCNYTSQSRNAVMIHMRTHTGEKPFTCDVCGKSFATKCTLERHTPTHTGERPYGCKACEKTFPFKAALNRHFRQRHSEEPRERYACELCSETFSTKFVLRRHYKRKHSKEYYGIREDNIVLEPVNDMEFIDALNYGT